MISRPTLSLPRDLKVCTRLLCLSAILFAAQATANLEYGPAPDSAVEAACAGDVDGDCINDAFEDWIASQVAPIIFYDEDESCVGGIDSSYAGANDDRQYDRKDFYQVRPRNDHVADWRADDGKSKTLVVTFIFAYPHDCAFWGGGHQGDLEQVKYWLKSTDMQTWSLTAAHYRYHSYGKTMPGDVVEAISSGLGFKRPIIASSEGSHASYFSNDINNTSSRCFSDGEHKVSGFGVGMDDCFCKLTDGSNGSPLECYYDVNKQQGRWQNVADSLLTNVGEPEQLRESEYLVSDDAGGVYTAFDLGHGLVREYWSANPPSNENENFDRFCGWECPNDRRKDNGHCSIRIHKSKKCVGSLRGKLDATAFWLYERPVPTGTDKNCRHNPDPERCPQQ